MQDYISVVVHCVSSDWELCKKVIGLRLVDSKHTGEHIARIITLCDSRIWFS